MKNKNNPHLGYNEAMVYISENGFHFGTKMLACARSLAATMCAMLPKTILRSFQQAVYDGSIPRAYDTIVNMYKMLREPVPRYILAYSQHEGLWDVFATAVSTEIEGCELYLEKYTKWMFEHGVDNKMVDFIVKKEGNK